VLLLTWLVVANPNATVRQIALEHPIHVTLALAAAIALAARRRLMQAVDRRFFREAYDANNYCTPRSLGKYLHVYRTPETEKPRTIATPR